ncbi:MAG: hypothetical protein LW636_09415, partial [Planctomycetaceae bacterium]|nr:hypothetical protein [Planctomycetaceae bacterium]
MSTDPASSSSPRPAPRASAYDADLEREIADALEGMSVEDLEAASQQKSASGRGRQVRQGTIIRIHSGD